MTESTRLSASEKIFSVFQPDTLLSAQFFEARRRKTLLEPEKKLMLAVLEDAVHCFQDNHWARCGKNRQIFDAAQKWIFEAGRDWVFGFENICSALALNPEYVRGGLKGWRQRESTKRRSAPLTPRLNNGPN
jgi:hypothetical protein